MVNAKERLTGWKFSDLVNAAVHSSGESIGEFARRHKLDVREVKLVIDDKATNSAIVVELLDALNWSAEEVQEYLRHLDAIPLTEGREIKLVQRNTDRAANRSGSAPQGNPGPLFVAYMDPTTLNCQRVEFARERDGSDIASSVLSETFIERHILGRSWMRLYNRQEIDAYVEQLQNVQHGRPTRQLFVETSIGMLRFCYSKAGPLACVRVDILDPRVVPIQHGLQMGLKRAECMISID